jgi:hypothetical protein
VYTKEHPKTVILQNLKGTPKNSSQKNPFKPIGT